MGFGIARDTHDFCLGANMPNQTVRWGKDARGDRVLEVVSVQQLSKEQAENMLILLDRNIARAVETLEGLRRGRVELAGLLKTGPDPDATE